MHLPTQQSKTMEGSETIETSDQSSDSESESEPPTIFPFNNGEDNSSETEDKDLDLRELKILGSKKISADINPSEVTDCPWVHCDPPNVTEEELEATFGKWLVFRPFSQIVETWHMIQREVEDGVLSSLTTQAKVATVCYDPDCSGPGPRTSSVICVFTNSSNVDKAGFALIEILKHDLKYKTDEATLDGKYAWKGGKKSVCLKTLYWNDGKPSFTREGQTCYGPDCRHITDEWHLNEVFAPASIMEKSTVYGRWVVELEYEWGLTWLWQFLKKVIEKGKLGPVEMVCPPKRNRKDPSEKPVFLIYTAYENKEYIGRTLAVLIEEGVRYELGRSAYRGTQPFYNHRIEWNDGDPVYVMTRVRRLRMKTW